MTHIKYTFAVFLCLSLYSLPAQANQPFERVRFPGEQSQSFLSAELRPVSAANSIVITLDYDAVSGKLAIVEFKLSPKFPPRTRKDTLRDASYVFQCEDKNGNVLGNFPVSDPNLMRHDHAHFEPGEMHGIIEGKEFKVDAARFEVSIPYVSGLANVRLLEMEHDPDGNPVRLKSVGAAPVSEPRIGIDKNVKGLLP